MNYFFTLFFSTLICMSYAQSGYQIRIKTENMNADSLFIKAYNTKDKKFTNLYALKFENDITLKDKTPLGAGIYIIETDSAIISEFLISDDKNQKFTILLLDDEIKVEGSKENSANRAYMKQMLEYAHQMRALNAEFQMMQQKEMPNSMMQNYIDTFVVKLNHNYAEKRAYQEKVINENKGLLLASIIQCSLEAPPPPQSFYRDRVKLFTYMADHLFDDFTWEDIRLLNTPVLYNKFKAFAQQILPLDAEISIPVVMKVLNESKNNRELYYAFFDFLEQEFGSVKSLYRDELLYIAMLKDILSLPDIEESRKMRYEYELNIISRNQAGEQATDFNILLSTGDTTNLYAIDADLLMLYFQHPDCPSCREIREKMKNMELIYNAITSGKLKIVTVYFEQNEDLWRNYLKTSAYNHWVHGWNYDLEISEKHLYDVRIIPMIMILDKDKRIIKKDLLSNEIEDWLKRYLF